MAFEEPPRLTVGDHYDVSVDLRGRPRSGLWRMLSGTRLRPIVARFTTVGGSLAWATITSPVRMHVLFTGRPDDEGRCVTRTFVFCATRPGLEWVRGLGLMGSLLRHDRQILDSLEFRPAFSEGDEPLRAFAGVVNDLGAW